MTARDARLDGTGPMARALALAAGALGRTSPNPAVGAVVVQGDAPGGTIVGEGATRGWGESHAEVVALADAGERARGASLFVTLEPCDHWGRTPPCTDAVIAAGIRRVVVATLDPNPLVAGRGVARLQAAGVTVDMSSDADRRIARTLMAGFATWIATRRPHVVAKFAASLDGRIATRTGESRWITGEAARRWAHGVRDRVDAILVGVGTVVADDPALTVRNASDDTVLTDPLIAGVRPAPSGHGAGHPLRVVLDTRLQTPPGARVASGTLPGRTLIVGVDDGTDAWMLRRRTIERPGTGAGHDGRVEVATVPAGPDGRPDAAAVLDLLGARGIASLLVEGGAAVHHAFLRDGLVDRVAAVIAPMVIGGGPVAVGGPSTGPARLADAWRLASPEVERMGDDLCVTGWLRRAAWPDFDVPARRPPGDPS